MFGWLVRIGLGFVVPYIIPSLIGLVFGGGFIANWWFQWLKVNDVTLIIAGVILVYLYAIATSEWLKMLYVAGMVGVGYMAGNFHEHDKQQARIEAVRLQVHKQYKDTRDAEITRLEAVNKELRDKAADVATTHMDERAKLRKERDDAIEAAKKLPGADDTFYTPDDIDVLNKLRHNRKRSRVQSKR